MNYKIPELGKYISLIDARLDNGFLPADTIIDVQYYNLYYKEGDVYIEIKGRDPLSFKLFFLQDFCKPLPKVGQKFKNKKDGSIIKVKEFYDELTFLSDEEMEGYGGEIYNQHYYISANFFNDFEEVIE